MRRGCAASCLKRPSAVRLRGVECGSYGSSSTTQPKRVRLVRLLRRVEPLVEPLPLAPGGAGADAVALVGGGRAVGEVLVEVLLAGQDRAPRGGAAGAVVEGAEHLPAGRVGGRLQQVAAGGRAGELEDAGGGEAAVQPVPGDGRQLAAAALLLHDDDGHAVGGPGDLDLLAGRVLRVVAAEHERLVAVLVVRDEDLAAVLAAQRQQRQEVVVVTELHGLRLGGLLLRVERGRAAQDGVAPADDHVLRVAGGDGDPVGGVGRDGREAQAPRAVGPAGLPAARAPALGRGGVRLRRGGDDGGARRGRHGDGGGRTHHGAAGEGAGYDVAGVFVVAGVRHVLEARVTAAVAAGEGGTTARVRGVVNSGSSLRTWSSFGAPRADIVSEYLPAGR